MELEDFQRKSKQRFAGAGATGTLPQGFDVWGAGQIANRLAVASAGEMQLERIFASIPHQLDVRAALVAADLECSKLKRMNSKVIARGDQHLAKRSNICKLQEGGTKVESNLKDKNTPLLTFVFNSAGVSGFKLHKSFESAAVSGKRKQSRDNETHEFEALADHTLASLARVLTQACPTPHLAPTDGSATTGAVFMFDDQLYMEDPDTDSTHFVTHLEQFLATKRMLKTPAVAAGGRHWARHSLVDTTLASVQLSLGGAILFKHSDGCAHTLSLVDMRLISEEDARARGKEPCPSYIAVKGVDRPLCNVCALNTAEFKCFGDDLADASPMLYCGDCYHKQHYTAENQLRAGANFKVYRC